MADGIDRAGRAHFGDTYSTLALDLDHNVVNAYLTDLRITGPLTTAALAVHRDMDVRLIRWHRAAYSIHALEGAMTGVMAWAQRHTSSVKVYSAGVSPIGVIVGTNNPAAACRSASLRQAAGGVRVLVEKGSMAVDDVAVERPTAEPTTGPHH